MTSYYIARSIQEIDEELWDAIAGSEIALTHRWQRVMEAGWRDYHPRYIFVQDKQGPLAIGIVSLSASFDLTSLRARMLQKLILESIPPFASASCGVKVRSGTPLPAALPQIDHVLSKMAWQEKRLLIGISNVPTDELDAWRAQRFLAMAQPRISVLDLAPDYEQYLQNLTKKGRAELRRIRRRADSLDVSFDHAPLAGEGNQVYALLCEVFARHGTPADKMPFTAEWFTLLECEMPNEMMFFKGYVGKKLVGVAPCWLNEGTLWWPMVGLHYELAHSSYMYFLLIDEMIRWSIKHGIKRIYGGLTSEREKKRHGFELQARWFCCRLYPPLLNKMLDIAVPLARRFKSCLASHSPENAPRRNSK